jgi:hypothetical protein
MIPTSRHFAEDEKWANGNLIFVPGKQRENPQT